jgi:prephenate dehydrogenase
VAVVFKKIAVFGVGLIGGSFALGLKKSGAVERIVGVGRSAAAIQRACELGIIDSAAASAADAVRDADLVLIAAPVAQTAAILRGIAPHLQPHTVVTDAGSTKSDVVQAAREALGDRVAQFVPGHPIAGGERNGPEAALAGLYQGKKVVLTALPENTSEQVERVAQAWRLCGAEIHHLMPQEHDRVFAAVSHLPHLLAFALVDDMTRQPHADVLFQYAASGFRDFTRIAASSPEMWRDIALANQPALLHELDGYMAQLQRMRAALAAGDGAQLHAMFANAQQARHTWGAAMEKPEEGAK